MEIIWGWYLDCYFRFTWEWLLGLNILLLCKNVVVRVASKTPGIHFSVFTVVQIQKYKNLLCFVSGKHFIIFLTWNTYITHPKHGLNAFSNPTWNRSFKFVS